MSEKLREELYASYKNRAHIYHQMYLELEKELGPEKAEETMQRAIYARGTEIGKKFAKFAPSDLQGLEEAFLGGIPDDGKMFGPEVLRSDESALDIKFHACPLRDAWQEAGLSDEMIAKLCRIAARIDNGTFESAGFRFWAETWQPGGDGCCVLHIRPGES